MKYLYTEKLLYLCYFSKFEYFFFFFFFIGNKKEEFSVQENIDCIYKTKSNGGCSGGWPTDAYSYA
jgi:hypothetical protein